jgi:hypothetical protein
MEDFKVMRIKEVAILIKEPTSWVYTHWRKLGGVKVAGKIFFTKGGLEDALSREDERGAEVSGPGHGGRSEKQQQVVRHQKGGAGLGRRRTETDEKISADLERYGIKHFLHALLEGNGNAEFEENLFGKENSV